jgi:cytidine deaminase
MPVAFHPQVHRAARFRRAAIQQVSSQERERLLQAASAALQRAYAPYSKFQVGAAVLAESGQVYTGCNVENASYGLTICAERAAVCAAIAAEGPRMKIRALAVRSVPVVACSPCGACRQVIFEFGPDALVFFQGSDGVAQATARELLPAGFVL